MGEEIPEIALEHVDVPRSTTLAYRGSTRSQQSVWMGVTVGNDPEKPPQTKKMLLVLLLVTLFWGLSVFLPSLQAYLETPTSLGRATILFVFVVGYLSGAIPYILFQYQQLKQVTYRIHRFAFMAGLLQAVAHSGYTMLIRSGGESSLLAPLAGGLYLVIPVFMGLVFLHEPVTPQKIIGILLAIGAILLLSITDTSSFSLTSGLTLLFFAMAFFGWGFDVFFMSIMGMTPHHAAVVCIHCTGLTVGTIVLVPSYGDLSMTPLTLGHYLNFLAGFCSVIGSVLYYSLSHIQRDSSLVAPLSSLYIIWPVMWGLVFLHDVVTLGKIIGIIVAVFAILLMSIVDFKTFYHGVKTAVCRTNRVAPVTKITLPAIRESPA